MPRKKLLIIFLAAAGVLLALFLWHGGQWLVMEAPLQRADAMVILMGSIADRALEADDVYRAGYATRIVFTQPMQRGREYTDGRSLRIPDFADLTLDALTQLDIPHDSVTILPRGATSTREEAETISQYLLDNPQVGTIILVSSQAHLRRATMTFRREFRRAGVDCVIIPRPSKYSNFRARGWYRDRESAKAVLDEYMRITGWLLGL